MGAGSSLLELKNLSEQEKTNIVSSLKTTYETRKLANSVNSDNSNDIIDTSYSDESGMIQSLKL